MNTLTIGDLSNSYQLRQRNTALKEQMARLTTELATGRVSDVRQVLSGNQLYLTDIERKLDVLTSYNVATSEAQHFAEATQAALAQMADVGSDLSASLLTAGTSAIGPTGSDTAAEARSAFEAIVGLMNTNVAGRHLFSGTATDQRPLVDATDLLNGLQGAIAGATSPDDVLTAAQLWFDDPAGFALVAYRGSDNAMIPFALSQSETAALDVRATDDALKELLRLTAVAALADDPSFAFGLEEQSALFDKAGQSMLAAQDDLTVLQANVGSVEARIEQSRTRNAAETGSLEYAKSRLLDVDPYETATRLEDIQFQLQSLYSVTVRNAQLSLVNFL